MFKKIILGTLLVLFADASRVLDPRIVNGQVAHEGQFPWQVGVVSVKSSILNYCAGAIISEEWILTAAHCIYKTDSVMIIYGTTDLEDTDADISVSSNYIVHEEFNYDTMNNDIGLVLVNESLIFNDNVQPITLADEELEAGTEVTVIGWGSTGDDDHTDMFDVLRYVSVTTIENSDCEAVYGPSVVHPGLVCTDPGNPIKNPCRGDGGDPVVVNADTDPVHVAIFSFLSSTGCEDSRYPAGYTRTSYYRNWIRQLTNV